MKNKLDVSKIKVGELMATISYEKVISVKKDEILVENIATGDRYTIQGKPLIEQMYSADQYSSEKKVGKFEMAELLQANSNLPITVNFDKVDGTNRTFRGYVTHPESLMGRNYANDFEDGLKQKQVDNRSVKFAIINGVKYTVK